MASTVSTIRGCRWSTAVERYRQAGTLQYGIAFFLGWTLSRRPGLTPQEAAEEMAYGDALALTRPPSPTLPPVGAESTAALAAPTRRALAAIDEARSCRLSAWRRLGLGPAHAPAPPDCDIVRSFAGPPLKYVIVATGNIYDDADQARAAAQVGPTSLRSFVRRRSR